MSVGLISPAPVVREKMFERNWRLVGEDRPLISRPLDRKVDSAMKAIVGDSLAASGVARSLKGRLTATARRNQRVLPNGATLKCGPGLHGSAGRLAWESRGFLTPLDATHDPLRELLYSVCLGNRCVTSVRKTPSWPRSWANFSLSSFYG